MKKPPCNKINTGGVSVLTAVYNRATYIVEAVESILNQTFEEFEFIIVDDGSTDGSTKIVQQLAKKDPRINLIIQDNAGIGAATNRALAASTGRYVAIMDSDDIALPHRLATQKTYLDEHSDIAAVGSQWLMIDTAGRLVGLDTHPTNPAIVETLMYGYYALHHPTTMMRREAIEAVGGYKEDRSRLAIDYDLFMRMQLAGFRMVNLPQVLYQWRLNPAGATLGRRVIQTRWTCRVRNKGFRTIQRQNPKKAESIAREIVSTFPEGTWLDQKTAQVLPDEPEPVYLCEWRKQNSGNHHFDLDKRIVAWLRGEYSKVSLLSKALEQNNLPWLAELALAHGGQIDSRKTPSLDLTGNHQGEENLLSILLPFSGDGKEFKQRWDNVLECLKGKEAEIVVFHDRGQDIEPLSLPSPSHRLKILQSKDYGDSCPWQKALQVSKGRYLAYLEPGFRLDPSIFEQNLDDLRRANEKIIFTPANHYYLEALDENGKPFPDPTPHPHWRKGPLLGRERIQLSGFCHIRGLLDDAPLVLTECGQLAPWAIARYLAVSCDFAVSDGRMIFYVVPLRLENRILITFQRKLLQWYFDSGLGALPQEAMWPALDKRAWDRIAKALSEGWAKRRLYIYGKNRDLIKKFFLKYCAQPLRWPLFRHLVNEDRIAMFSELWHNRRYTLGALALAYGAASKLQGGGRRKFQRFWGNQL